MKNAVIIVNYNRADLLEKCLQSLLRVREGDIKIYVVDNGSSDGSVEIMRQKFPTVCVITMGYNAGFCKGNNAGITRAINDGCENVILLNNDTEVDAYFITEAVKGIDLDKKIGMVAPRILLHRDRDIVDSAGLVITPDGLAKNRFLGQHTNQANSVSEVFCPAGAAAVYSVAVLNDIKHDDMYFDEDYEYYLEDLDMGWRSRLRGWRCMYQPTSIVYHHGGATSGGYSALVAFYTNRNIFYNIIKNYPFPYCVKALFLTCMRYPLLVWGAIGKRGAVSKFTKNITICELVGLVLRGWKDVVVHAWALCKKRHYVQKRRNVSRSTLSHFFTEFGEKFLSTLYK